MKKLSCRLFVLMVALMATMMTGCAPWVNTTNSPHGTSYSSNRNLPRDYIPRSFTANLEAGPEGMSMLWVGNPDSAALANLANVKIYQDTFWILEAERMRIDNAIRARETLPGGAIRSSVFLENKTGKWVWLRTGPNKGLAICPTQGAIVRLPAGSRPHLSFDVLRERPVNNGHTPPGSLIVDGYTEDNWIVPSTDNWVSVGGNSVNGVYVIGVIGRQCQGGGYRPWNWYVLRGY